MHGENRDRDSQKVEVVTVRQPLHDERERESGQRAARAGLNVSMQPDERQWHPARHQHLEMPDVPESCRSEREDRPRHNRRIVSAGQAPGEPPHPDAGQRERRDECDVVRDKGPAREPHDWRDRHADAEQMLGKCERAPIRIEDRRIPQAGEAVAQAIGVPSENPRVEQRIAEVARQRLIDMKRQRPGDPDAQQNETEANGELRRSLHRKRHRW